MHWRPPKPFLSFFQFSPKTKWLRSLPFNRLLGHPNGHTYVTYHFSSPMHWSGDEIMHWCPPKIFTKYFPIFTSTYWSTSLPFSRLLGYLKRHAYVIYHFSPLIHWCPPKHFLHFFPFSPPKIGPSHSLPFNRLLGHPKMHNYVTCHFSPPIHWWDGDIFWFI